MTRKERFIKCGKISKRKFRELLRYFALDIEANKIAKLTNLNRNTVNRYYQIIRERIREYCIQDYQVSGEIEVDESYFGRKKYQGKRGRGSDNKVIVMGLLKRGGRVYTQIIPDCSRRTLQSIIKGKVELSSDIHSDGWRGYNGLVDLGYRKHYRIDHSEKEFARGKAHINGIENFWGIAKNRLIKFRGIKKANFELHLKECEFRFNYRNYNIYKLLLKLF